MKTLHLFEAFGVEVEYMIVDKTTLMPLPVASEIIHEEMGDYVCAVDRGKMSWSNEFVMHVVEIQAARPEPLPGTDQKIHTEVTYINQLLEKHHAMLMPSGIHPFLNPKTDARLWPYENHHIYETFDRIFDCRRHGWVNLQSCQINLPFCGDVEFEKLHAAIRFLMPILPALAASTPIAEGQFTGHADFRLESYRTNSSIIPSISGDVIPEPSYSYNAYQTDILERIYRDIRPFDTDGILGYEWLNARGAIARFDRNAIEIRILDMQECPAADIAICEVIVAIIKKLVAGQLLPLEEMKQWSTQDLKLIYTDCARLGEDAIITNTAYLKGLGVQQSNLLVKDVWKLILSDVPTPAEVTHILNQGTLSKRILKALKEDYSQTNLIRVYKKLSGCLASNRQFDLTE